MSEDRPTLAEIAAAQSELDAQINAPRRSVPMRVTQIPRAAAMLQDATSIISSALRQIKTTSERSQIDPKQTKMLLDLLSALEKTQALEAKVAADLRLESLDDATLRARALDALGALATSVPDATHNDGTKDA